MPRDSNWNTAAVFAVRNMSYDCASSSGSVSSSTADVGIEAAGCSAASSRGS